MKLTVTAGVYVPHWLYSSVCVTTRESVNSVKCSSCS